MMTQPIVIFKDLTSETEPAGGNVAKTGFSHEDRRLLERSARYARSRMIAHLLTDAILWVAGQYRRAGAALKANFRLRAAEAQLYLRAIANVRSRPVPRRHSVRRPRGGHRRRRAGVRDPHRPRRGGNRNTNPSLFWAGGRNCGVA